MNHTQKLLLERAAEIRAEEGENATWGGPDPRGPKAAYERLKWAAELERLARMEPMEYD